MSDEFGESMFDDEEQDTEYIEVRGRAMAASPSRAVSFPCDLTMLPLLLSPHRRLA